MFKCVAAITCCFPAAVMCCCLTAIKCCCLATITLCCLTFVVCYICVEPFTCSNDHDAVHLPPLSVWPLWHRLHCCSLVHSKLCFLLAAAVLLTNPWQCCHYYQVLLPGHVCKIAIIWCCVTVTVAVSLHTCICIASATHHCIASIFGCQLNNHVVMYIES